MRLVIALTFLNNTSSVRCVVWTPHAASAP